MNKMFTAVATLQLVERGKLSLDDTIGKILPDYPNTNVAIKVKIRHLLSHTGGTGDIFGPEFEAHRLELKTLQDYVKLYGKRDLRVRARHQMGILQLRIPAARRDHREESRGSRTTTSSPRTSTKSPGMTNSGSEPESVEVANRSKGYMRDQFEMVSNEPTLPWRGTSAGGGYTTAADLMKFADALMSNKLLKAETLAEATASAIHDGRLWLRIPDRAAGRGADLRPRRRRARNERILRVYPESRQSVIVLCNLDSPSASRMGDWLHARMPLR